MNNAANAVELRLPLMMRAAFIGALAGVAIMRTVARRLAHHAAETPFAAEALSHDEQAAYKRRAFWLSLIGAGTAFALLCWPALPFFMVGFAAASAIVARVPAGERTAWSVPRSGLRSRSAKLAAGIVAATALWLALAELEGIMRSLVAAAVLLVGLRMLAPLDADLLRFEGRIGIGVGQSLRCHLGGVAAWYGTVGIVTAIAGGAEAALLGVIGSVALSLNVARLLGYRATTKRTADLKVVGILVLCGTVASLSPGWTWLALPFALLALVWLLLRAMRDRWLLA